MENIMTITFIPVFLIMVLMEWGYLKKIRKREYYRLNDAITNLNVGIGFMLTRLFSNGLLMGAYMFFYEDLAIFRMENNIWTWIAAFFMFDFLFYWAHRWGHEINLFWAAHSVHHQSEDYNLTVALRQSWLHSLMAFFIFLPVPFLGMPPEVFFPTLAISSLYQFWIHTEAIGKMPKWFEYLFNTPAHHRVHHAVNPEYIDRNHGATLIIWDRLFGTFAEEQHHPSYGVTKPINTWNPLWANLVYFKEMWDMGKQMKLIDRVKLIFKRPGWRPEYLGGQIPVPEVSSQLQKYDVVAPNPGLNTYVLLQFILIIPGLIGYLYYFSMLSPFQRGIGLAALLLTSIICGAIMEQKSWVKYAEYARLALVLVAINSIYYFSFQEWFLITLVVSIVMAVYFAVWYTLNVWMNIEFIPWLQAAVEKRRG
jgi:sterol desaturase/sphingolipid hydroxylase (fatty acid hydroxylase superfamily)